MHGSEFIDEIDDKIFCGETNADITFRANIIQGFLAAYTFTLVIEGWLTIVYNGKELTLTSGDIYIYSPGMPVTITAASDNYRAICLMADEHTTIELPSVHDLVHIASALHITPVYLSRVVRQVTSRTVVDEAEQPHHLSVLDDIHATLLAIASIQKIVVRQASIYRILP